MNAKNHDHMNNLFIEIYLWYLYCLKSFWLIKDVQ